MASGKGRTGGAAKTGGRRTSSATPRAARPAGRPRAFDREDALDAATQVFWRKGYNGASMLDLTSAMGIGSASLYATFGSKEQLYAEAIDHYARRYAPLIWGDFHTAGTVRDAVAGVLMKSADVLDGLRENTPAGCMVALDLARGGDGGALGAHAAAVRAKGREWMMARLRTAAAEGEIGPYADIQALGRFVQVVYSGMTLLAREGAIQAELKATAEIALEAWDARIRASFTGAPAAGGDRAGFERNLASDDPG